MKNPFSTTKLTPLAAAADEIEALAKRLSKITEPISERIAELREESASSDYIERNLELTTGKGATAEAIATAIDIRLAAVAIAERLVPHLQQLASESGAARATCLDYATAGAFEDLKKHFSELKARQLARTTEAAQQESAWLDRFAPAPATDIIRASNRHARFPIHSLDKQNPLASWAAWLRQLERQNATLQERASAKVAA